MILRDTGVHAVIPAMMDIRHLSVNIRAVEHCRFTSDELATLRAVLTTEADSSAKFQPV